MIVLLLWCDSCLCFRHIWWQTSPVPVWNGEWTVGGGGVLLSLFWNTFALLLFSVFSQDEMDVFWVSLHLLPTPGAAVFRKTSCLSVCSHVCAHTRVPSCMSLPSRSRESNCTKLLRSVAQACCKGSLPLYTLAVEESFHSFSTYCGINQMCKYPIKLLCAHLQNVFRSFIFLKSCLSTILKGINPQIT